MIAAGPRSRKMEFPMNRTRYSRRDVKDDAVAVEAQAEEVKARYTKVFRGVIPNGRGFSNSPPHQGGGRRKSGDR
jgi:hypothetical protein